MRGDLFLQVESLFTPAKLHWTRQHPKEKKLEMSALTLEIKLVTKNHVIVDVKCDNGHLYDFLKPMDVSGRGNMFIIIEPDKHVRLHVVAGTPAFERLEAGRNPTGIS